MDINEMMKGLGVGDIIEKFKREEPAMLSAKVKYLEKLNGGLLTFMVKNGLMTRDEASKIIQKARDS